MSVLADTMASRRDAGARRPLLAVLHDWVVTVDHKRLGVMYVVSGLVFLVVAGLEASAMRLQLASSGLHLRAAGDVQPALHHARDHHGVPGGNPHRVRIRATTWCR